MLKAETLGCGGTDEMSEAPYMTSSRKIVCICQAADLFFCQGHL